MGINKKNLLIALIASFAVAVVGAIVWGVAYYFEFFAAIISYISAFGMYKIYEKFDNVSKLTYVWIIGISILLNAIACIVVIAIILPGVNVFEVIFLNDETAVAFAKDMLFSIVFTVAGVISVVSYNKKRERQKAILSQYEMEKIKNDLKKEQEQSEVSEEVIQELKNDMNNIETESTMQVEEIQTNEDKKDN